MNDSSKILFRASSLSSLMTNPRDKKEELSMTCKTELKNVFVASKYKRREEVESKFLDKGNEREADAIVLYSLIKKGDFTKNKIRLYNDYIQGEPDFFQGESIYKAKETIDTKCSWSAFTFFRVQGEKLNPDYLWQGNGYMWLTGAERHTVAYCLVNGTPQNIMDEKRKLAYKMGILDMSGNDSPEFKEKCKQIEINNIFDINAFYNENPYFAFDNELEEWSYDIPAEDRLYTITIERNEDDIRALQDRIGSCRKFMDKNLFKVSPIEIAQKKIKRLKELQKITSK